MFLKTIPFYKKIATWGICIHCVYLLQKPCKKIIFFLIVFISTSYRIDMVNSNKNCENYFIIFVTSSTYLSILYLEVWFILDFLYWSSGCLLEEAVKQKADLFYKALPLCDWMYSTWVYMPYLAHLFESVRNVFSDVFYRLSTVCWIISVCLFSSSLKSTHFLKCCPDVFDPK